MCIRDRDLVGLIDDACAPRPGERPTAAEFSETLGELLHSGRLRMQRLLRAQRLVRPLKRAGVVAERVAGAGLAAVTSGVVLGALPAYPQSWSLSARRCGPWCRRAGSPFCSACWRSPCSTCR